MTGRTRVDEKIQDESIVLEWARGEMAGPELVAGSDNAEMRACKMMIVTVS